MEFIALIAVLVVVMLTWSRIGKSMDWAGARVGETTDLISDATQSATMQTAKVKIFSKDDLLDEVLVSRQKSVNRTTSRTKFEKGLTDDQKKDISGHDKWLEELANRY